MRQGSSRSCSPCRVRRWTSAGTTIPMTRRPRTQFGRVRPSIGCWGEWGLLFPFVFIRGQNQSRFMGRTGPRIRTNGHEWIQGMEGTGHLIRVGPCGLHGRSDGARRSADKSVRPSQRWRGGGCCFPGMRRQATPVLRIGPRYRAPVARTGGKVAHRHRRGFPLPSPP